MFSWGRDPLGCWTSSSRRWTASYRNGLRQLQHTLDTGVLNSWQTVLGWIQLRLCLPSVWLFGWKSLLMVPVHCQMVPSLWCTFQSGKMVMLMLTPMCVCLYDQQEPSLCVHLCASLPICTAPNYYISYVVMFCKKWEPFGSLNIYNKYSQTTTQQYLTGMLQNLMYCLFWNCRKFRFPDCVTQSDASANLDRN